jgi:hypothetical protein
MNDTNGSEREYFKIIDSEKYENSDNSDKPVKVDINVSQYGVTKPVRKILRAKIIHDRNS